MRNAIGYFAGSKAIEECNVLTEYCTEVVATLAFLWKV
jgi:hypothetical protein